MKNNQTIARIFCILDRGMGTIDDTSYFEGKKHNELVDEFCNYLEKHRSFISNHLEITQALNDRGTDLILKDESCKLGFQIKSHYDVNEKKFAANVKRQCTEASAHGLDKWYLLICSPLKSKGKDLSGKIQSLYNEISSYKRDDIEVYTPRNTIKFFKDALPLSEEEFASKPYDQVNHGIHVNFFAKYIEGCSKGELYELKITVENNSKNKTINQYKLEFNFPDLSVQTTTFSNGSVGYVQDNGLTGENVSFRKNNGVYQVTYHSKFPLLAGDNYDVSKDIVFRYCSPPNLRGSEHLVITWNLHTDDGFSLNGETNIFDLWQSSR